MSNAQVHPVIQEALAPFAPPQRQSLSLYEIEHEFQQLLEQDEATPPTPEDEAAYVARLQQMVAADEACIAKRDRCAEFLRHLEHQQAAIEDEQNRLSQLHDAYARTERRFKAYLENVMESLGVRRLEGRTSVISLRKNQPSVVLDDRTKIPPEYVDVSTITEVHVSKKRIKAALLAGEQVPGARLVTDRQSVQVR
jgi:hypothetical protein